jgi:hypothetical protein
MNKSNYNFLFKPVFFIVTLIVATMLILWIERLKPSDMGDYQTVFQREMVISKSNNYPLRSSGKISVQELNYARIAWKYFENNYNSSTGFVNGSDQDPIVTVSELGSYLMALSSAYELKIIDSTAFDNKIRKFCDGVKKMKLFANTLPNKIYNAATLEMLSNSLQPSANGYSWSALDISRFLAGVNKISRDYPEYHNLIINAISSWGIENMIYEGYLYCAVRTGNKIIKTQEGTIGYEEYCAKNLIRAGYDAANALSYTDFIKFIPVYSALIGVDTRNKKNGLPPNYLVSEPFILDGLENGWDNNSRELAYRIYTAQKDRYLETSFVTALAAEPDVKEELTFNCLYAGGETWCCINKNGEERKELKQISTKAAFGWSSLFNDDYSDILLNSVKYLNNPQKGWYCGKYEKDGKANKIINAETNAYVLEAINFKKNGKLIRL